MKICSMGAQAPPTSNTATEAEKHAAAVRRPACADRQDAAVSSGLDASKYHAAGLN
jgi:hypothetical protein